jgi:hypothetical protein
VTKQTMADEARLRAEVRQEKMRLREQVAAETERQQQDMRQATQDKVSRLRDLRLAREAMQQETATRLKAEQAAAPPAPKRSHKAKPKAQQDGDPAEL